jgi:polar amino acid transport system substrate-binding protein
MTRTASLKSLLVFCLGLAALSAPASARSLEVIQKTGVIGVCAHPNALPFSSKNGDLPGFQIELARAIAQKLGVSLEPDWVVTAFQIRAAQCDILMDAIADPEAQGESHLKLSKPYAHSGAALVVRAQSPVKSFADLDGKTKVGVMVGSYASMLLDKRHVRISMFGFEDDMLAALGAGEIDAAMVTPASAGFYNLRHPDQPLRIVGLDEEDQGLTWNVAVGMVRPDPALIAAINQALDELSRDGTIARIYARYGVTLLPPR